MKEFFSDRDLAAVLALSTSWVRQQRFLRRRGLPHILDIDPVMIGSSPRYRRADVEALVRELNTQEGPPASQVVHPSAMP